MSKASIIARLEEMAGSPFDAFDLELVNEAIDLGPAGVGFILAMGQFRQAGVTADQIRGALSGGLTADPNFNPTQDEVNAGRPGPGGVTLPPEGSRGEWDEKKNPPPPPPPVDDPAFKQLIDDYNDSSNIHQSSKEDAFLEGLLNIIGAGALTAAQAAAVEDIASKGSSTFRTRLRGQFEEKDEKDGKGGGGAIPVPSPVPPKPPKPPVPVPGHHPRPPKKPIKPPPRDPDPVDDPDPIVEEKKTDTVQVPIPGTFVTPNLVGLLRPEFIKAGADAVKESKVATLLDKEAFDEFDEDLRTNPNQSTKEFANPLRDNQITENSLRFVNSVMPTRPKQKPAPSRFRRSRMSKTFFHSDQNPELNKPFRFLLS